LETTVFWIISIACFFGCLENSFVVDYIDSLFFGCLEDSFVVQPTLSTHIKPSDVHQALMCARDQSMAKA